ncbi:MAG: DUF4358 domain-containing protein [Clostridia bacterium]|nr:DUF4358 domain-containing protein [Clostridia bacterium]
MKKTLILMLAAAMLLTSMLTSCTTSGDGGNSAGTSEGETTAAEENTPVEPNFEGTLSEILAQITEKSGNEAINGMEEVLTGDISEFTVGLTADQMTQYVEEGIIFMPMINVNAHMVALIKAKDVESAATLKGLLAEQFDNRRWVCVMPEQSAVIEAGQYVMLAVSTKDFSNNLLNAFAEIAGPAAGEANIFFEGEGEFIPEDEILG